ncbi:MAG: guanylate kinase, partial [Parvibaculaceae bacterium]
MTGIAIHRRGLMLVLSSPSGAGKTTLSRRLLESDRERDMAGSATTRKPSPGEVEGKDYFFLTTDDCGS